jgi:hypothetical protein
VHLDVDVVQGVVRAVTGVQMLDRDHHRTGRGRLRLGAGGRELRRAVGGTEAVHQVTGGDFGRLREALAAAVDGQVAAGLEEAPLGPLAR